MQLLADSGHTTAVQAPRLQDTSRASGIHCLPSHSCRYLSGWCLLGDCGLAQWPSRMALVVQSTPKAHSGLCTDSSLPG